MLARAVAVAVVNPLARPCNPEVDRLGRQLVSVVGRAVREALPQADAATLATIERRLAPLLQVSRGRARGS